MDGRSALTPKIARDGTSEVTRSGAAGLFQVT